MSHIEAGINRPLRLGLVLALALLGVFAVLAAGSQTASAAVCLPQTSPDRPPECVDAASKAWVYYKETYNLANSTVETVDGVVDPATGTCDLPDTQFSLSPSQTVLDKRVTGFNSQKCLFQIETGVPPANQVTADENTDTQAANTVASNASPATEVVAASSGTHSKGYLRSWWEDPAGIDVTVVRNGTDWHWDRTCTRSPVYGSYSYHWYTPSGWGLHENNWQNSYRCYDSTSSSYVHFQNGIFCSGFDVDTYYNRNSIHGRYDGYLIGRWHSYNRGAPCKDWLHFHSRLRRTLN